MKTYAVKKGNDYFYHVGNKKVAAQGKVPKDRIEHVKELMSFAQIEIYMNTCNTNPEDCTTEIIEGRIYDVTRPAWL